MLRLRIVDAGLRTLVVKDRCARLHRCFRIEHGRKDFVVDTELAATGFGGGFALGHHGSDALADEADDPVQDRGVVGIDASILMSGARIELAGASS